MSKNYDSIIRCIKNLSSREFNKLLNSAKKIHQDEQKAKQEYIQNAKAEYGNLWKCIYKYHKINNSFSLKISGETFFVKSHKIEHVAMIQKHDFQQLIAFLDIIDLILNSVDIYPHSFEYDNDYEQSYHINGQYLNMHILVSGKIIISYKFADYGDIDVTNINNPKFISEIKKTIKTLAKARDNLSNIEDNFCSNYIAISKLKIKV